MNKRGFTLIELLAVIVILAIIALIATPIILGIINDARESAKKRSSELVYAGVEYAYTTAMYQQANAGDDVSIDEVYANFNVENVEKKSGSSVANNAASFEVETAEGVTCTVTAPTASTLGYDVNCVSGSTTYLSHKLVRTKTATN